jgi:histidyl-tRNA synthetase
LEALGFNDAQARSILTVIDRYEKAGDDAFKVYAEAHGPLAPELKDKVLAFLKIKGLGELEAALAPYGSDKLAARLADWRKVLGGVSAMGLADYIAVDLSVVRGLAYYTGFVFEAFDRKGDLRALAGGGRYNDLVKKLGGPDLPAVGFAIGDVTTGLLLEQRGLAPAYSTAPQVYVVVGGEAERPAAFADIQALRAAGLKVEYPFKDLAFGKQFKAASECGAKLALVYGGDELAKGVVKVRNLTDRSEQDIPRDQVVTRVRGLLGAS